MSRRGKSQYHLGELYRNAFGSDGRPTDYQEPFPARIVSTNMDKRTVYYDAGQMGAGEATLCLPYCHPDTGEGILYAPRRDSWTFIFKYGGEAYCMPAFFIPRNEVGAVPGSSKLDKTTGKLKSLSDGDVWIRGRLGNTVKVNDTGSVVAKADATSQHIWTTAKTAVAAVHKNMALHHFGGTFSWVSGKDFANMTLLVKRKPTDTTNLLEIYTGAQTNGLNIYLRDVDDNVAATLILQDDGNIVLRSDLGKTITVDGGTGPVYVNSDDKIYLGKSVAASGYDKVARLGDAVLTNLSTGIGVITTGSSHVKAS